MPPTIINSGTPLTGSIGGELWTDKCDASADLVNQTNLPPVTIPLAGLNGNGSENRQVVVSHAGLIDKITVNATLRGRWGDNFTLKLKHEKYGELQVVSGRQIDQSAPLDVPYPNAPTENDITLLYGQAIPSGYRFLRYVGNPQHVEFVLPQGVSPQNNYYYSYYNGAGDISIKSVGPTPTPYTISVPAHRNPASPNEGGGDYHTLAGFNQDGYAYTPISSSTNPTLVNTVTFVQTVGPFTNEGSWLDFQALNLGSWGEKLFSLYGAHIYTEINSYSTTSTVGTYIFTSTYHVLQFWRYPDRRWQVQAPAQVTWQGQIPPQAVYRWYGPDYDDYANMSKRTMPVSVDLLDWYNQDPTGLLTLEATINPNIYFSGSSVPPEGDVTPANSGIDNLSVTITFKQNQPYQQAALTPTTSGSDTFAQASGTLFQVADDRAMLAILCGIQGSQKMGILCGYAIERVDLTKPTYSVSYFIATTCNIGNVNYTRMRSSITFPAQDWSGFSTKGNDGRAYVISITGNKIYPAEGQIGMKVKINGNRLTFQLLGDYPELVYQDPTVALVDNFSRYSLNA